MHVCVGLGGCSRTDGLTSFSSSSSSSCAPNVIGRSSSSASTSSSLRKPASSCDGWLTQGGTAGELTNHKWKEACEGRHRYVCRYVHRRRRRHRRPAAAPYPRAPPVVVVVRSGQCGCIVSFSFKSSVRPTEQPRACDDRGPNGQPAHVGPAQTSKTTKRGPSLLPPSTRGTRGGPRRSARCRRPPSRWGGGRRRARTSPAAGTSPRRLVLFCFVGCWGKEGERMGGDRGMRGMGCL